MDPNLVPIIIPRVDWATFLGVAGEALGYQPARVADSNPRPLSDAAKFVVVLSSFQDRTISNAISALHGSLDLLNHLSYSFAVYADDETMKQVMERTDLKVAMTEAVNKERIAVVSGSLKAWYCATLTCCQERQPYNLRLLFDKAVMFFEGNGLAELWHDTRKRTLPDRTFLLEHKP